mmetsp:Transcript_1786/g.4342  ORF Transcript_1786/g.4342 Transcript_1786/m.4342 type:complete len:205 (+) Transcript_1786:418-1032(+)
MQGRPSVWLPCSITGPLTSLPWSSADETVNVRNAADDGDVAATASATEAEATVAGIDGPAEGEASEAQRLGAQLLVLSSSKLMSLLSEMTLTSSISSSASTAEESTGCDTGDDAAMGATVMAAMAVGVTAWLSIAVGSTEEWPDSASGSQTMFFSNCCRAARSARRSFVTATVPTRRVEWPTPLREPSGNEAPLPLKVSTSELK